METASPNGLTTKELVLEARREARDDRKEITRRFDELDTKVDNLCLTEAVTRTEMGVIKNTLKILGTGVVGIVIVLVGAGVTAALG